MLATFWFELSIKKCVCCTPYVEQSFEINHVADARLAQSFLAGDRGQSGEIPSILKIICRLECLRLNQRQEASELHGLTHIGGGSCLETPFFISCCGSSREGNDG